MTKEGITVSDEKPHDTFEPTLTDDQIERIWQTQWGNSNSTVLRRRAFARALEGAIFLSKIQVPNGYALIRLNRREGDPK